jgi:hypothetical protein
MTTFKAIPKKNVTDDPKLALFGEPWREGDYSKKPSMKLRVINSTGNPKSEVKQSTVGVWITVYLNHPDENDDAKKIDIKMDAVISSTFIAAIERAIKNREATMLGIDNMGYTFVGGNKSDKPTSLGKVFVGRNGEGVLCLVVDAPNRPRALFPFTPTFWWALINKNGDKISAVEASELVAEGWVAIVRPLLAMAVKETYDDKEAAHRKAELEANRNSQGNSGGYSKPYEKKSYDDKKSYEKKPYNNPKPTTTDVFDSIH